jgi:transcription factor E
MTLSANLIQDLLKEIAGADTIPLVNYINRKINVSEFKIAEKLEINVNQVRNILYRLGQYNLVSSIRKKDKKKGWYIYYWTFHENHALSLVESFKRKKIERLKRVFDEESKLIHFICPDDHMSMPFDEAMEYEFKCRECGKLLREEDKKKKLDSIRRKINELEAS